MNFWSKLAALLVISFLGWGCDNFFTPTGPTSPSDQKSPEPNLPPTSPSVIPIAEIVLETNNQRKINGAGPLLENLKLNVVADYKMKDMFARQYFDHFGPDSTSGLQELLIKFGYQYKIAGENLAMGDFKNAAKLVALWMNSPGHRANILDKRFTEIGVAVGEDVFGNRRTKIAVQILATK